MTRDEKIVKAKELRADGWTYREIARWLGYRSAGSVHHLLNAEPLGKRSCAGCGDDITGGHGKQKWCSEYCRKDTTYGGSPCIDCGAPTKYAGRTPGSKRCNACARTVNAERNQRILELWEDGAPAWYIAKEVGVSPQAVLGWCDNERRRGRPVSKHRLGGNAEERQARREQIIQWRREGLTAEQIADFHGYSSAKAVQSVIAHYRKRGFDFPPRKRGRKAVPA